MLFGPCNTPSFYSAVAKVLQSKWDEIILPNFANLRRHKKYEVDNNLTNINNLKIENKDIKAGSNIIIGAILLFGHIIDLVLIYMECLFNDC